MNGTKTRSALVSLFTAGSEVILFACSTLLLTGPALLVARWVFGALGSGANFALNRRLVFDVRGPATAQVGRFLATAGVGVTLSTTLWWVLTQATPVDLRLLHVLSMMSVWLVFTYPTMRRWVFAPARPTVAACAAARASVQARAPKPQHRAGRGGAHPRCETWPGAPVPRRRSRATTRQLSCATNDQAWSGALAGGSGSV